MGAYERKVSEYELRNCTYSCLSKKQMLYVADKVIDCIAADVNLDICQKSATYSRDHVDVEFTLSVSSADPEKFPANDPEVFGVKCCSCCKKKKLIKIVGLSEHKCFSCNLDYQLCEECTYHVITDQVVENRDRSDMATKTFCSIACYEAAEIAPSFTNYQTKD